VSRPVYQIFLPYGISHNLPKSGVIADAAKIADMVWLWEVFGALTCLTLIHHSNLKCGSVFVGQATTKTTQ
jgi:hypothetical protein